MLQMLLKRVWFFAGAGFLLFPVVCSAFTVSPSVADVSFASEDPVVQTISVKNTTDTVQVYEAKVQEVFFAEDGSIASLTDVNSDVEASIDATSLVLEPGAEETFMVTFRNPEAITSSQVFGLLITEQGSDAQQISGGFVALLFPEDVATEVLPTFRIDLFTIVQDGGDLRVVAQFANTGEVLVRPSSIIVVTNRFDREIGRFVFADYEGRLPVGTTRVLSEILHLDSFGAFHLGGDVTFTLLSLADGGSEVQQASVVFATRPGMGVFFLGGIALLLFLISIGVFVKRRGILRA